jgi:hypothetical protein
LYQTKNSYSRILSAAVEAEATTETTAAAASSDLHGEEEANTSHHDAEGSSSSAEELAHELSIEVSYEDTYDTLIFLGVSFIMGEIAYYIGIPPLVGQIICGFLLGPPLADYVPFPQSMVLLGDLGLILLLVEAGVELDVALVKEAGIRPFLIAIAGSIIPFAIGLGVTLAQGDQSIYKFGSGGQRTQWG